MKIAIISDIHGNLSALNNVLKEIKKNSIDKIFCLGDIVMAGYKPNETAEIILNLAKEYGKNFEIIQGNTDKMVAFYSKELLELAKNKFPCMGYALCDDIQIIKPEIKEYIKNLPENKYVEVNGIKIQLVHGSPRKQDENIFPNLSAEEVEKMVKTSNADIIFCGHTHLPCGYSLNSGKTVVNVGSVGRSMAENKMPYWVLFEIFDDGTFNIEHKMTKYDNIEVAKLIKKRGFPHSEELAAMYLKAGEALDD